MAPKAKDNDRGDPVRSFLVVILIALAVLAWGGAIFFLVGDRGQPDWDYGTIADVPGKSPFSTRVNP